jgi:two-component system, LytTR family, sensor kinase
MAKQIFKGNILKIMLHLLAWSILLGLPLYFIKRWHVGKDFIWLYYINTVISGIIFYANYLLLVPKYFFSNRNFRYYLSVLLLIVFFYFISDISNKLVFRYASDNLKFDQFDRHREDNRRRTLPPGGGGALMARPPFRGMHLYNYAFTSIFLVFFSIGLKVLERQDEIEKASKEMEREKLNSELAFLKNQISPHFFFNTLNNIYSLVSINPEDSQKAILKLSKLMRYLLYESEQGNVNLSSEIAFISNYIDLMKLRMSDKISLSFTFPKQYEDISIPPLLFIPFIENAFKHGISYNHNSFVKIDMRMEGKSLIFICENSLARTTEENNIENGGIGLENVRKRLGLLFPGRYEMNITSDNKTFKVFLEIKLT